MSDDGWGLDGPLAGIEPHEPVNVSEAMAEASGPAPERITQPTDAHQVERIAKSESRPIFED